MTELEWEPKDYKPTEQEIREFKEMLATLRSGDGAGHGTLIIIPALEPYIVDVEITSRDVNEDGLLELSWRR